MSDNKGRSTMFRRKEEDAQEELDVSSSGDKSAAASAPRAAAAPKPAPAAGNAPAGAAAPAGRAPAPAASAPVGARPQGGAAPAPRPAATSPTSAAPRAAAPQQPSAGPAATPAAAPAAASNANNKANKRILTVGNDILLKGEIATCDRLVIEGMVDATLKDVHTVEISESGSFKGTAEIQDAEISGLFEGDLIVHNRLTIYSSGKVRGKISYGEIEIERGGQMTGEIRIGSEGAGKSEKDQKAA